MDIRNRKGFNQIYERNNVSPFIIAILAVLYIFSIMGSSYFGVDFGGFKLSPFRLLFLLLVAYTVLIFRPMYIPRESSRFLVFYLLWFVWGFISIVWAKDRGKALTSDIILFIALCTMVICCQILRSRRNIQVILITISICFVFVTYIGLYETLTGHYYFVKKATILDRMAIDKYRAPLVFFTNQNDYSLFLVYGIFVALYIQSCTNIIIRLLYDVTIAVAVWLIIFADSRGCALALAVGVVYWIYTIIKNERRKSYIWLIFIITSAVIIVVALNAGRIVSVLTGFFHFGLETASITSDAIRLQLVKNGIDMVFRTIGFGVGLSNSGYYLENIYRNTGMIWALHNWFIQIFAESGILIGVLYLCQYIIMYNKMKTIYYSSLDPIEKKQAQLFLTVIVAFVVGLLSPSSVFDMEWLWLTWALIIAFIGQAYSSHKDMGDY